MSTCTKETSSRTSPRPPTPPTTDDEGVDTPQASQLALPQPRFTFAFTSDSRSDLRLVSFICEDGDNLGKPIAFLQHDFEEFPSEEEWYRNLDRDTILVEAPEWTPPPTATGEDFNAVILDRPTFVEDPSLQPPQSSTASAFAFFQNHFLNRPDRPLESETSSVSSGSCYSRSSGESADCSDDSWYDCKREQRERGTVNSSTLGGLDVYMRTGSIIHWTHHPQYAARIDRGSQPSFLRGLFTWADDRFDFDPVTPFARDWQTKVDTDTGAGEESNTDAASASRPESSVNESERERVREQAPIANTREPTQGASPSSRKRLRKPRPPQPSPSEHPFDQPKAKSSPLPGCNVFAQLEAIISCPNRKRVDNPPGSTSFRILLPRPRLDAFLHCGSKTQNSTASTHRRAAGKEPWVWVDISSSRSASSQR